MTDKSERVDQAAVLALAQHCRGQWHVLARLLGESGNATAVAQGRFSGFEAPELLNWLDRSELPLSLEEIARYDDMIEAAAAEKIRLVTVLDDEYPRNLSLVYDRPPFLFVRGHLDPADDRSLAVVGT